jgi:glycosyl transferase, family 25
VHAYVVNLARSFDRRAHIISELRKTGLSYEIFPAVDERDVDLSDSSIIDPSFTAEVVLAAGTIGSALSHIGIYKKIIADQLDKALVLEDDITLPTDLVSLVKAVSEQMTGAEVALLSVDCPEPCQMSLEHAIPLPGSRLLALPIDIFKPRSSGAYVITREACERMVKVTFPIRVQADAWWYFYREGILDRVRCVAPLPVLKSPELTSVIGSYALGGGIKARLVAPLLRRRIPVLHQVLSYRRQRVLRQWAQVEFVETPFVEMPSRLD